MTPITSLAAVQSAYERAIRLGAAPEEAVATIAQALCLPMDAGMVRADHPMREAMRRFTTLPRKGTPASDLTEGERLALCIAAGAPTETVMEGGLMTMRTTVPCGVADRGDGGYIVAVGARPNVKLSGHQRPARKDEDGSTD